MEDLLIEILQTFGFPVKRQGSLANDEPYPDNFFTFWSVSADGDAFYDNDENAIVYTYNVNFYSVDPESVYTVLRRAKKELRNAGFDAWGDAHDVTSDEPTHDGRGITISFIKFLQGE